MALEDDEIETLIADTFERNYRRTVTTVYTQAHVDDIVTKAKRELLADFIDSLGFAFIPAETWTLIDAKCIEVGVAASTDPDKIVARLRALNAKEAG